MTRSLPPSTRIPALLPPQEPRWEPSPLPLRRTTGLRTLPMMVNGQVRAYTVTAGESLALVIPGGSSIVTRVNQPATVLWSSNAALMAPNKEFNYRIDLYEGNYANEAALSGRKPVATYTVGKDKNSVRIGENVLSKLSNGNTPAYTVLVSMPHPTPAVRTSACRHLPGSSCRHRLPQPS